MGDDIAHYGEGWRKAPRFSRFDQKFLATLNLAPDSPLLGEICQEKGLSHSYGTGQAQSDTITQYISRAGDAFPGEAASLGSLGLVATGKRHYKSAGIRLRYSVSGAARRGILGNMGWSYLRWGLWCSLALFKQAICIGETSSVSAQIDRTCITNCMTTEPLNARTGLRLILRASAQAIAECFGNLARLLRKPGMRRSAHDYNIEMANYARSFPTPTLN